MLHIGIVLLLLGLAMWVVHKDYGEHGFAIYSLILIIFIVPVNFVIDINVYPNLLSAVCMIIAALGMWSIQVFVKPVSTTESEIVERQ